jgi:hypothetical protein
VRRTRSTRLVRSALTAPTSVVATVLLVAAACSGDGDDGARRDRTTTTVDQEAAVLAAYEAAWQAFEEASADPVDPAHPALAETMTGPALAAVQQSLSEMAELQRHIQGGVDLSPEVVEISGNRAEVEDCVTDHGQQIAADGSVVVRSDATPHTIRTIMVRDGGAWKRSELNRGQPCGP